MACSFVFVLSYLVGVQIELGALVLVLLSLRFLVRVADVGRRGLYFARQFINRTRCEPERTDLFRFLVPDYTACAPQCRSRSAYAACSSSQALPRTGCCDLRTRCSASASSQSKHFLQHLIFSLHQVHMYGSARTDALVFLVFLDLLQLAHRRRRIADDLRASRARA